jgi:hypothetical protein
MTQDLVAEFSGGWTCDNAMMVTAIRAGESVDPGELIELCSGARTLFNLVTLVSRSLDRVSDCRRTWTDALETFREAQDAWIGVPTGHDPLLRFYLLQLERLNELATSRVDLYSISQSERVAFVRRYKSDLVEDRTAKSDGEPDSEEARIKAFLSLPI